MLFGSGSSSTRSAGRGSGANKTIGQTAKSAVSSITSDIKMGISTFGQSKEKQAQTLRDLGYSERAINSYQERTAASAARAAAAGSGGDGESSSRGLTAQQKYEAKKAEELAKRRAEGQARRKKFEKKVGRQVARRRKLLKLINIGTGD